MTVPPARPNRTARILLAVAAVVAGVLVLICAVAVFANRDTPASPAPSPATLGPTPEAPVYPTLTTIQDGTWTVGVDMPAGTWRTDREVDVNCYWVVTVTGSNGTEQVSAGRVGGGHATVPVEVGQDFYSEQCGTWSKVD